MKENLKIPSQKGPKRKVRGRYWNSDHHGICIVAVITEGIDWAAYIGADNGWSADHCMFRAAEYGVKLDANDAHHFFPEMELPYRH